MSECLCFLIYLTNDNLVALLERVGRDLEVQWCGSLTDTSRDIVVGTVARAVPSTIVTSLSNWDASQVSADTQHDQPLGLLGALSIVLGITELGNVDSVGLINLIGGTVTDEDGLSTPLDGNVTTLGDGAEVDLDLGQSQNIGGGRHVGQKVSDGGLGSKEGDSTGGSDHEVGKGTVGGVARSALVLAKVRDVGSLAGGGVVETLLVRETSGGGDKGAVVVQRGRLQGGDRGGGGRFVVSVVSVVIIGGVEGRSVEDGAETGGGGRKGDEGAVQRG